MDTSGQISTKGQQLADMLRESRIVDLTVILSPDYPAATAIGQPFLKLEFDIYGKPNIAVPGGMDPKECIYKDHVLMMNEHVGTHCDVGPHVLPDVEQYPDLPHSHRQGAESLEKVEPSRFWGPADVIDVRDLIGTAGPGLSPIITVDRVKKWEAEHGQIMPGDVVLFHTGWTDLHYKPFPEGFDLDRNCRFYKRTEGWPAPDAETAQYCVERGARCIGLDTVSIGSIQDDGGPHLTALAGGAVLVEKLTRLGELPPRGAFFLFLPIKVAGSTGGPGRAVAIV